MRKITGIDPDPPVEKNRNLEKGVSDFIMKGLEKAPANRYASGKEMLDRLMILRAGVTGEIREAWRIFRDGAEDKAISMLASRMDECPDNIEVCLALSRMHNQRWDFLQSERALRRGLRHNRNSHQLHATLAEVLNSLGKKVEAEAERGIARELGAHRGGS
jgi:uncharacterized protein HemY